MTRSDARAAALSYSRSGSGPALVLLHGVGHDRTAWDPLLDRLSGMRDVIVLDLPGHGDSPCLPAGASYTVEAYVHAVADLIKVLGLDRPQVAGNSLGGAIALELARTGVAGSAIALAPIGFWSPAEIRFTMVSLRLSRVLARLARPLAPLLTRHAITRTLLLAQFYGHPARLTPAAALAATTAFADSTALPATLRHTRHYRFAPTPAVTAPVTIAWGTRDRLLLPSQARRARRALPYARHLWLPGSGHVPMSDDPDRVAALILGTPNDGSPSSADPYRAGGLPI